LQALLGASRSDNATTLREKPGMCLRDTYAPLRPTSIGCTCDPSRIELLFASIEDICIPRFLTRPALALELLPVSKVYNMLMVIGRLT
jgi:hypothetical protein